jgi:hypothetical protein
MDKAWSKVEGMLVLLRYRYTQYLPPVKYDSTVNTAMENLCGMELAPGKDATG